MVGYYILLSYIVSNSPALPTLAILVPTTLWDMSGNILPSRGLLGRILWGKVGATPTAKLGLRCEVKVAALGGSSA